MIFDYKVGKHLGAGAYALVKQAIHKPTGMLVAIKIYDKVKLIDATRRHCVHREATVLTQLNHPNLLRLYDVIDSANQLYLIMEFVRGYNLTSHLKHDIFKINKTVSNTDFFGSSFTEVKAAHIIK